MDNYVTCYSSLVCVHGVLSITRGGWNNDNAQHTPQVCSTMGDMDKGTTDDRIQHTLIH